MKLILQIYVAYVAGTMTVAGIRTAIDAALMKKRRAKMDEILAKYEDRFELKEEPETSA